MFLGVTSAQNFMLIKFNPSNYLNISCIGPYKMKCFVLPELAYPENLFMISDFFQYQKFKYTRIRPVLVKNLVIVASVANK